MSSKVERKLAAIMFTDIAGYTEQMSKDEDKAFALIKKIRGLLLPLLKKYEGKLIKEIGDGTLTRYFKADNAIACATQFQSKTDSSLNIRAGIHMGEVIIDKEDVFGDVVNIASRLESLATPGSIFVSKETIDKLEISDKIELISLGLQSLKGVGRLIEVYAVKNDSLVVPNPDNYLENKIDVHSDDEVPSIAIIPFKNKGREEDMFYAYGISADLISDITSAGLIRVASKKQIEEMDDLPMNKLAKKLLVRYVVTGELWRMDNMFQLSIELFDTKELKVLWSDRWEEKWEHLPEIKVKLSDGLLKALDSKQKINVPVDTINSEAYEYYLQAKYRYSKREDIEDIENARQLLKKSLELDNNLINAKVLLGFTYFDTGEYDTAMQIFKEGLNQIRGKDDKSSKAALLHTIGIIHWKKGDNKKAIENLNISLVNRNHINDKQGIGNSHNVFGAVYFNMGDYKKAFKSFKKSFEIYNTLDHDMGKAQALDNLGVIDTINCNYNHALRHYKTSIQIKKKLEDNRGISFGLTNLGILYYKTGDYEAALENYHQALKLSKNLNIKYAISNLMDNMGVILRDKEQFVEALDYHIKSLAIKEEEEDKFGITKVMNSIGIDYYMMKDYKSSILHLEKTLDWKNKIGLDDPSLLLEIKTYLFLSYKALQYKYDDNEIIQLSKKADNIEFDLNYHLYLLLEERVYLEKAYELIQEIIQSLDADKKIKFLNLAIPKKIIQEWEK